MPKAYRSGAAQRGLAVIMAILVAALAASVASFMLWQQQIWARQVENLVALAQAEAIGRAANEWTRMVLVEDAKSGNIDHLGEIWATVVPGLPVEGGRVALALTDQQGLFNLNNLVREGKPSDPDILAFGRLLQALELSPDLANAVADWIDADSEVLFPGGAEDLDYLSFETPYRAANRLLLDVNGLIRVKGFDAEAIQRLRPFVTALPTLTAINVNTASPQVLVTLFEDLNLDAAKAVAPEKGKYYQNKADFKTRLPRSGENVRDDSFGIDTRYFIATAVISFGRVQLVQRTLLAREADKVNVIWQKHGDI